jgi:hypothetical protein
MLLHGLILINYTQELQYFTHFTFYMSNGTDIYERAQVLSPVCYVVNARDPLERTTLATRYFLIPCFVLQLLAVDR